MGVDVFAALRRSSLRLRTPSLSSASCFFRHRVAYIAPVARNSVRHTAPPLWCLSPLLFFRHHSCTPLFFLSADVRTYYRSSASCFGLIRPSHVLLAKRRLHASATESKRKNRSNKKRLSHGKIARQKARSKLHFSRRALAGKTTSRSPIRKKAEPSLSTQKGCSTTPVMKPTFYAVAIGKQRGIYSTWDQCAEQVKGYSGAIYKSFRTLAEARAYLAAHPAPSTSPRDGFNDNASVPSASNAPSLGISKHPREDSNDAADDASAETLLPPTQHTKVERERTCAAHEPQGPLTSSVSLSSSRLHQVMYVDGACSYNGTPHARAGYGGYFGSTNDARNFSLPVPSTEAQTNNRGELRAVIHGIVQGFVDAGIPKEALDISHYVTPNWRVSELARPLRRLIIYTDSRYVIDGLTRYSIKWVENGFKLASKEPVLNQDLWKQLIRLRDAYNTCYAQQQYEAESSTSASTSLPPKKYHTRNTRNDEAEGIELRYVRGHSNDHGNEMADMLAVRGARMHNKRR